MMRVSHSRIAQLLGIALIASCVVQVTTLLAATLEERVATASKTAICERNRFNPADVEITMHTLRSLNRYNDATSVKVTLPDYDDAVGPVTGHAIFLKDGEELGSIPVPMRVTVFGEVLVTAARVKRHVEIKASDVERQRVDVTRLVGRTLCEPDSIVGHWLTRTMSAGQIIDRKWVEDVPLVRRGDRVTMEYGTNNVQVSANVTAMEDGYRNQTIAVKTDYANRLVHAVVIDESTVHPVR